MTETELIQALKNKDSQAFQYVYDLYYKKIKSLCYGKVGNTEDAEDLTQEVFIDLYNSINKFRGDSTVYTWLHRVALNKSFNFSKKKKIRNIFVNNDELMAQHPDKHEDENLKSKQIKDLQKAIAALPKQQAKAFTLFFYEGVPQKDIVEIMELNSVAAVEQLVHRAKLNIKKNMSLDGED